MALSYRWLCFWLVSLFAVGNLSAISASGNGYSINSTTGQQTARTWTLTYTVTFVSPNYKIHYTATSSLGGVYISGNRPGLSSGLVPTGSTVHPTGLEVREIYSNANNIVYLNTPLFIPAQITTESQTVTVSPSLTTMRVGQDVILTASGGQNGYNWSATNGGSLAHSGSSATFTASAAETYLVQVWSPAGSGYSESNYATATITVTASEFVKVKLPANTTGRPIEYWFYADGTTIGTETQNIKAPERTVEVMLPPSVPSGTPVDVVYKVVGIVRDSETGTWSVLEGAVTTGTVATVTPSTNPTVVGPDSPDFIGPKIPDGFQLTSGEDGKAVWSAPPNTGSLTDKAYKEGIDKTTSALSEINKTLKGQGSSGGGGGTGEETGDTGTHDRLDSIAEKMDAEAASIQAALDANPSAGQASSSGSSAASSESAAVKQLDAPNVSVSASAPVFGITMPAAFGGRTFDLNPFQSSRFASICAWHRKACEWLAIVLFGLWCAKEASAMSRGLTAARQATGNAVFGGTGGQATAFIAAGIITVIIAVAIVALFTFSTTNLGGGTLLSVIDDDPFSGLVGGAVWMMDQLFPLGAVIACFAGRLVWQAASQSAFMAAAAAIRFVVP